MYVLSCCSDIVLLITRIPNTVADNLTPTLLAVAYQIRIVLSGERIHGHRGLDTVLVQDIQDTENAHAMAVVPMCEEGVIWKRSRSYTPGQGRAKAVRR